MDVYQEKNTCIELMELISKQNNIFRKIEEIYKFDLVANEWTVIEKEDSNSDFNTAFDELMNERFDVNMDIKEKIKTLKILDVKLDDIIDDVLFWNEDMASKFYEWNLKRNKNFDPYGEFPITMYNYYIDELRSSIRTNKELQIKYTQKDFNKLFTIN